MEKAIVKKAWKIFGREGHRQRESFGESVVYDFSEGNNVRIIEVEREDKTGTNEYVIFRVTCNSLADCLEELVAQLSDGIFENSKFGRIEEI